MRTAEVQQVRMLITALRDAITELETQISAAETRWQHRLSRCTHEIETPQRLVRLRAQLDEAQQLLTRLRAHQAATRSTIVAVRPTARDQGPLNARTSSADGNASTANPGDHPSISLVV